MGAKIFDIFIVLAAIGMLIFALHQITRIPWNSLPWATGHATEPTIIERSVP